MARKGLTRTAVVLALLAAAGCTRDDPRLKELDPGITKDSALSAIGVRVGERPATYLMKGQLIEALMIRREGVEGPLDSLTHKQYTPVVIIDGKLAGWGWTYWDSVSHAIGVPQ